MDPEGRTPPFRRLTCLSVGTGSFWKDFFELVLWYLRVGRAGKPGPRPQHVAVEVFNVGVWLTHEDLALEAEVDYLAVAPRVRSEWSQLRGKSLALSGHLLPRILLMLVMLVWLVNMRGSCCFAYACHCSIYALF